MHILQLSLNYITLQFCFFFYLGCNFFFIACDARYHHTYTRSGYDTKQFSANVAQRLKNRRTWFKSYGGYNLEIMCDLNSAIAHHGGGPFLTLSTQVTAEHAYCANLGCGLCAAFTSCACLDEFHVAKTHVPHVLLSAHANCVSVLNILLNLHDTFFSSQSEHFSSFFF